MMKSLISCALVLAGLSVSANEGEAHAFTNFYPPKKANADKVAVPAKPELVAPAFDAQITATETALSWKAVQGADHYYVQVATDPNFKWIVNEDKMFAGTEFKAKGLEKGKRYYWRVSAMKTSNEPSYLKSYFETSAFEVK